MRRIPVILLFFGLSVAAAGKRPYQRVQGVFSGGEDYQVECILQDSTGIIWFGTNRGLFRYDGFSYDKFTVDDEVLYRVFDHQVTLKF